MSLMHASHDPYSANDAAFERFGTRPCAPLPAGLPGYWLGMPLAVSVDLIFTEDSSVFGSFVDDFTVSSVEEAMRNVARDDGIFLRYSFFNVAVAVPLLGWDADWPLLRRGQHEPAPTRRHVDEDREPGHRSWDRTVFEVRREPSSFSTGRLYLRVGGQSSGQAEKDWTTCARALRRIHRQR